MPRLARLDAPGILQNVIGRGIERKKIFFSDTDRSDFIDRLTDLVEDGAMDVYASALCDNLVERLIHGDMKGFSPNCFF